MSSRSRCYVQTHEIIYIKYVQIFVYQLHLNKSKKKIPVADFLYFGVTTWSFY